MSSDLAKAAETAVEQCLRVAPGESVVVVTDDKRAPIGEALYDEAVSAITDDATILRYPPADQHGTEPPARRSRPRWPRATPSSRRRRRA